MSRSSLTIVIALLALSAYAAEPVERELRGGETHSYPVTLAPGQFLRAVVEQCGIDVVVALRGPGGAQLFEMDGVIGIGPEELVWEAVEAGDYALEVRARVKSAGPGFYSAQVETAEIAGSRERAAVAAEQKFMDGRRAQLEASGESLERAIETYKASLARWRDAGSHRWQAVTLLNLGVVSTDLNEYEHARDYDEQALTIWRELGNRRGEAAVLNNLGNLYRMLSRYDQAREYCEQALAIWRDLKEKRGEAATLHNLGSVYHELGQYEQARFFYEQTLAIRREINDRRNEAATLNNLGNVYLQLNQVNRAREYYEQALTLWRAMKDRRGEGGVLNNLGDIYVNRKQFGKARTFYVQALAIHREVKERTGEETGLSNLGDIEMALHQFGKARDLYTQALAIDREIEDRSGEAMALSSLGVAYRKLGDDKSARESLEKALAISREIKARRTEGGTLYELAVLARHSGDLIAARAYATDALSIIESIRSDVAGHDLRSSFFASAQDYFALSIDVLMQLHARAPHSGHDAAAFELSERARARSLLDLLAEAHAEIREGADPVLVARERELEQQLNAAAAARQELLSGTHTAQQAAAIEKELGALASDYQDVQGRLRRSSPRYAALVQPQPLSLHDVQKHLLDEDTLLLVYSLGNERSFLWVVTHNSLTSFVLPAREKVETVARRFYELLTAPQRPNRQDETPAQVRERLTRVEAAYRSTASTLSRMLLLPAASELGDKRLLIISDGALQYVPFAALPAPSRSPLNDRPPLIVQHEIVHLPSASSVAVLRNDLAGRRAAPKALAVLADPVFSADDERVESRQSSGLGPQASDLLRKVRGPRPEARGLTGVRLARLPFARREAEAIIAAARPGTAMKALDFQASRETAISAALGDYRIVHFATHGLLDSARPELSGLVLSLVDEHGRAQDGFLRLHDIYNLHLPAELVVLSACQTGLGQDIKGEGLVGLTRGFMYAGAARVVASLWQVDDVATAELMRRFYRGMLHDGKRPAAALRAAQVAMWREGVWRSSYYWAGFVLQGEWR